MKPSNILLNEKGEAFIGDLGTAKIFKTEESVQKLNDASIQGTINWMSPEIRANIDKKTTRIQIPKSDVFSLGLIALFCLSNTDKFNEIRTKFNQSEDVLEDYLDEF